MKLMSEYFSDDGTRTAEITKQGLWFVAKLMREEKVVTHVTTFNEDDAEYAAQEWVDNDTV